MTPQAIQFGTYFIVTWGPLVLALTLTIVGIRLLMGGGGDGHGGGGHAPGWTQRIVAIVMIVIGLFLMIPAGVVIYSAHAGEWSLSGDQTQVQLCKNRQLGNLPMPAECANYGFAVQARPQAPQAQAPGIPALVGTITGSATPGATGSGQLFNGTCMPSGVQVVANNAGGFSLVDNTGGYFVCTGTFSPVFAGQTWVTTSAGATMVDTNSVPLKPGTEITVVAGRVYAISGTGTVVLKPKP